MRPILPKLAIAATILLLGLAMAGGVAWLKSAIPVGGIPDKPYPPAGRNPPIELASIPWKHDPAHPEPVREPMAVGGLAWLASVDRPGRVDLPGAVIPWLARPPKIGDDPGAVAIPVATLPWPIHSK